MKTDGGTLVVHDVEEGTHVVHVIAEIDIYTAPGLELEMEKASGAGRVIVDLTGCRYLDSSGYHALLRAVKAYGQRLRIVTLSGTVPDRVLRMMKLESITPILSSLEEARAA